MRGTSGNGMQHNVTQPQHSSTATEKCQAFHEIFAVGSLVLNKLTCMQVLRSGVTQKAPNNTYVLVVTGLGYGASDHVQCILVWLQVNLVHLQSCILSLSIRELRVDVGFFGS